MNKRSQDLSRRRFLVNSSLAAAGLALGHSFASGQTAIPDEQKKDKHAGSGPHSKAVLIRNKNVLTSAGIADASVAIRMIDEALVALTGAMTVDAAWRSLFHKDDRIGIKTNVYAQLPTPPDITALLRQRLTVTGIPEDAIPVTDREAHTLLADRTAILNIRPVRTHHWAGIGGCIKNHIMFVTNPSDYHGDSCADLGAIWNLPILKGKTRLNILLALNPLFYGRGPHNFDPRFQWNYGGIFVSTDPVAVDALGAELLRLKRVSFFGEDRAVTPTRHIAVADTKHGLGVSDLSRIDLVRIGWEDQILLG
jgi:hypothetical protein